MISLKKVTYGLMLLCLLSGSTVSAEAYKLSDTLDGLSADSQYNLGLLYYKGKGVPQDYVKAAEWFTRAANQGIVNAQVFIAEMYYNGRGVPQNYFETFKWYQKAANQGNFQAQYNLGNAYYNGNGVRQNYIQAKEWYGKACDSGFQNGCEMYRIINQR